MPFDPATVHVRLPVRQRDRARVERGDVAFVRAEGALFGEAPRPTDPLPGAIEDGYLLAAFAALARAAPEKLRALFAERDDGMIAVRFHRRVEVGSAEPQQVVVDRAVPVRRADGSPLYARCARAGEIWPLMAEKAYAAWKGGWDVIGEGGTAERTLEELTGEPTRLLFVSETAPEKLWSLLERATHEGWPVVLCTHGRAECPELEALGFHPNHLLVLLGVHEWMGQRIAWLRDPAEVPCAGSRVKPDPHGVFTLGWDELLAATAEVHLNGRAACEAALPPFPAQPLAEALEASYAFGALPPEERRRLVRAATRLEVPAGEPVARAGEPADASFVLQHGSAAIEAPGKRGPTARTAVLTAGGSFGELPALEGHAHVATLRALTPLLAYRLPAERLRELARRHPALLERFRQRADLHLAMLDWGSHQLTAHDVDGLLRAGHARKAPAGEAVFSPGEVADGVFLVLDGAVDLESAGKKGKRRERLTSGEVFGEVEALAHRPRQTTARAAVPTSLFKLDLGAAGEVLQRFDRVQRQLLAGAARREAARQGRRRHT